MHHIVLLGGGIHVFGVPLVVKKHKAVVALGSLNLG